MKSPYKAQEAIAIANPPFLLIFTETGLRSAKDRTITPKHDVIKADTAVSVNLYPRSNHTEKRNVNKEDEHDTAVLSETDISFKLVL